VGGGIRCDLFAGADLGGQSDSGLPNRHTPQRVQTNDTDMAGEQVGNNRKGQAPFFEVLTAEELAERWKVPVSWVQEQSRTRALDPIPHVRLGRYVRFSYGSPDLDKWWLRRQGGTHRAS